LHYLRPLARFGFAEFDSFVARESLGFSGAQHLEKKLVPRVDRKAAGTREASF